jgi:hypothetical protein
MASALEVVDFGSCDTFVWYAFLIDFLTIYFFVLVIDCGC